MEHFTVDGTWWLPESPAHRVPGTLTSDADNLGLVLYGSLLPTVDAPGQVLRQTGPDWTTTPVILGRTHDSQNVTLLDAQGANLIGRFVRQSDYRVRIALVGVHVTVDRFTEAWIEFDWLNAWADPPDLTERGDDLSLLTVRFGPVDLGYAQIDEGQVRLVAVVAGEAGGDTVHVEQRARFAIAVPAVSTQKLVETWIRPLQDLLVFSLGRPVRLTSMYLRPEGADRDDDLAKATFNAVQADSTSTPSRESVLGFNAPTLLTFTDSPMPFAELLPRWFQLRSELSDVVVLLHSPYYAPFMFSDHRYASTFQSAEALARACGFAGREKPKVEHQARVDAIVSAAQDAGVDEDDVAWAGRVLKARNDRPLIQQIQDLVTSTGEIGRYILAASPAFSRTVVGARTGVSHGGARSGIDAVQRHWHGDVLCWVVRAKVQMDLGIDALEVHRRVLQRGAFQYALEQIRTHPDVERSAFVAPPGCQLPSPT